MPSPNSPKDADFMARLKAAIVRSGAVEKPPVQVPSRGGLRERAAIMDQMRVLQAIEDHGNPVRPRDVPTTMTMDEYPSLEDYARPQRPVVTTGQAQIEEPIEMEFGPARIEPHPELTAEVGPAQVEDPEVELIRRAMAGLKKTKPLTGTK
mgnify:CR=1 FL=1